MDKLNENISTNKTKRNMKISVLVSVLAIIISITVYINLLQVKGRINNSSNGVEKINAFTEIKKTKVVRVGYGGFPPYTIINPNEKDPSKRVTGYSVDLINEIANLADTLKVEWVQFNWETIQTELQSGKFDVIADPVYQTIPRALEFSFSVPYAYFGIAVGIVRKDDNRFKTFNDLNRNDIIISLAKGWTSSEYAKKYLTNVPSKNFNEIPVSGDAFNQLDDVWLERADVALNDVPTVAQYAKANSKRVKAIFIDNPPSSVPGGFVTRLGEHDLLNFLNTSIYILMANGTLERLDEKWNTFHHIPYIPLKPANGLKY
jgi:ABC-type amino acid transport substrate-binding protein